MLQAKSIYRGGELLSAQSASYYDSVDLGLICPFCGKPVFLVKASERQRQGRTEQIPSHFSHHKADTESAKLCEARVLTKEGKEFLQQLSSESRGQRLSLFNRRLWEMIAWEKAFPKNLDKWLRVNAPDHYRSINQVIDHCWQHWQDPIERTQIKQAMPKAVELLSDDRVISLAGVDPNHPTMQQAVKFWQGDLNQRLQRLIAEEVVDYLAQPSAKKVFGNLVRLALFDAVPVSIHQNRPIHSNDIQYLILCTIGLTRWVAALEEFKSARSGDGFGLFR